MVGGPSIWDRFGFEGGGRRGRGGERRRGGGGGESGVLFFSRAPCSLSLTHEHEHAGAHTHTQAHPPARLILLSPIRNQTHRRLAKSGEEEEQLKAPSSPPRTRARAESSTQTQPITTCRPRRPPPRACRSSRSSSRRSPRLLGLPVLLPLPRPPLMRRCALPRAAGKER